MILKKIKNSLQQCAIRNCSIAVAVSGGADSIALLYALHTISQELSLKLSVVHVNYNLRGNESLQEMHYVKACCETLAIPCFTKSIEGLSLHDAAMESKARDIRYIFFNEIRLQQRVDYIAVAHNKNDQAETLLFRLARGTGLKGAGAMKQLRDDFILRPMLDCSRTEIESWLEKQDIPWHSDSSNGDNHYSRNAIRNEVMPLLTDINSHATDNLAAFSEQMQRLQSGIEAAFTEWFERSSLYESAHSLVLSTTVETPFLFAFIPFLFDRRGITVTQAHVDSILTFWTTAGKELLLSQGYHAITLGNRIIFKRRTSDEFFFQEQALSFTNGVCRVSPLFYIPEKEVPFGATAVRALQKRDSISKKGRTSTINAILKKRQVPHWLRERYPIFLNDAGEVIGFFP